MTQLYTLDDIGNPVAEPDTVKWSRWFRTADRSIENIYIGLAQISTVFLGMDHSHDGSVMLYKTMIFGGDHDNYQERYQNKAAAIDGHNRAVEMVLCTDKFD